MTLVQDIKTKRGRKTGVHSSGFESQRVAYAAHGLQELGLVSAGNLGTERADEDIERVVTDLGSATPTGLYQDVAGHHATRAARHIRPAARRRPR